MDNWKEINKLTLDFLKSISDSKYHKKPFASRFKSFSWEFACILSTRKMYLLGIKQGKLDGNTFCENDNELSKLSKSQIIKELIKTNKQVLSLKNKTIIYFGKKVRLNEILSRLMQHEQLHHGKLLLYFSKANIKIPKTFFEMWGY